ncbi:hypothetical protein L6164_033298 [Bauhinia variegata]|uniref:Uncharacterized protein n=1 Tax=Bauhinia variegata TaxID=167791 RepID=A0ACB9KRK8_BAUVA|nr:hypothetical protein L6164_033298 [Bauhinia variegata]
MASSSFVISSLVLLSLFSFPLSSLSMKTAKVDEICSRHRNPSFCAATLNSMTGGAIEVDLGSIGQNVILLAHTNAFDALTLIHSLISNTTDAQLKQHYVTCSGNYNDALFDLNQAKTALVSGDYNGVNTSAAAVKKDVEICDSNPPADPSPLHMKNKNLENLSIIVIIVSNFLAQNLLV